MYMLYMWMSCIYVGKLSWVLVKDLEEGLVVILIVFNIIIFMVYVILSYVVW